MDKEGWVILGFLVILFSLIACFAYGVDIEANTYTSYPIYKATLPFGVIQVQGNFVFGCGGTYGEEYYYIKYMVGDELHSLSLRANETPLKVDGKFLIEINQLGNGYIVHIPKLPEMNRTWTTDWIVK